MKIGDEYEDQEAVITSRADGLSFYSDSSISRLSSIGEILKAGGVR